MYYAFPLQPLRSSHSKSKLNEEVDRLIASSYRFAYTVNSLLIFLTQSRVQLEKNERSLLRVREFRRVTDTCSIRIPATEQDYFQLAIICSYTMFYFNVYTISF